MEGKGIPDRKWKKHMVEKRRRTRINYALLELKELTLEAFRRDPSKYDKMEKADILDLTVQYLERIHQSLPARGPIRPTPISANQSYPAVGEYSGQVSSHVDLNNNNISDHDRRLDVSDQEEGPSSCVSMNQSSGDDSDGSTEIKPSEVGFRPPKRSNFNQQAKDETCSDLPYRQSEAYPIESTRTLVKPVARHALSAFQPALSFEDSYPDLVLNLSSPRRPEPPLHSAFRRCGTVEDQRALPYPQQTAFRYSDSLSRIASASAR